MQQQIKITRNDLRKISLEFCKIASRLMKTKEYEGMAILKMFLNFIDSTPLLSEFIQENISKSSYDPSNLDIFALDLNRRYDNEENEISCVYLVLKSALKNREVFNDDDGYFVLAAMYRGDRKENLFDYFSSSFIQPFVNHILNYLEKLQIDLEEDEKAGMVVNNYGNDFTMNQGNTYQQSGTFGIGNMSGGTITGNAQIAGVINEAQSKNLTEVAEAIQDLLDYFEQNKPTEIEAVVEAWQNPE